MTLAAFAVVITLSGDYVSGPAILAIVLLVAISRTSVVERNLAGSYERGGTRIAFVRAKPDPTSRARAGPARLDQAGTAYPGQAPSRRTLTASRAGDGSPCPEVDFRTLAQRLALRSLAAETWATNARFRT
jgi:hypothetical protein